MWNSRTEEWKQGIPGLLNMVKTSCMKPLSCADATYFYSSTLIQSFSPSGKREQTSYVSSLLTKTAQGKYLLLSRANHSILVLGYFNDKRLQIRFHWHFVAQHGSAFDSSSTIFRILFPLHHSSRCGDSCCYSFLESHWEEDFSKIFKNKLHRCYLWVN